MAQVSTVNVRDARTGDKNQKYLVAGEGMALRMWQDEAPGDGGEMHGNDYETIGYVVSGKVELTVGEESVTLESGDSWHVPTGAAHRYRILESLTAVEATRPAARDAGA